jgi:hypothetical protein
MMPWHISMASVLPDCFFGQVSAVVQQRPRGATAANALAVEPFQQTGYTPGCIFKIARFDDVTHHGHCSLALRIEVIGDGVAGDTEVLGDRAHA